MELSAITTAARTLVSVDTAAQHEGSLPERLRKNLDSYHALLEEPLYGKLSRELALLKGKMVIHVEERALEARDIYWQFASAGLCLLHVLDSTLKCLQEEEPSPPLSSKRSTCPVAPAAPKSILSIADQKVVGVLVQFIVSLGVYPYLLPGVDTLMKLRMANAASVPKAVSLANGSKAWHLSTCCGVLLGCFENPILAPVLMSQYLADTLAALLQVCYGPSDPEDQQHNPELEGDSIGECLLTPADIASRERHLSRPSGYTITAAERDECMEGLQRLLHRVYQPLVIRELLTLQGMSGRGGGGQKLQGKASGGGAALRGPRWLQKVCGQLLSERLMQKNGVQHVLRGILEATSSAGGCAEDAASDWRKCQAIARILSSCPAQAASVEEYYSLVCPQVVALLHLPKEGVGRQLLGVAVATISTMLAQQPLLAGRYLTEPLLRPLMQLAGDLPVGQAELESFGRALQVCAEDLSKICSVVEPSSPLVMSLLPYLPVLFDVWRTCQSGDSWNVISRILKPIDTATVLQFLKFLARISPARSPNEKQQEVGFRSTLPGFVLQVDGTSGLSVRLATKESGTNGESIEAMEDIAGCLLEILRTELKSSDVPSLLFMECLQHIAAVLCRATGYDAAGTSIGIRLVEERERKAAAKKPTSKGSSSSALLELEEDLELQTSSGSFANALILYLAASLCEKMSGEVIERVELPGVLEVISVIVNCHARFASEPQQPQDYCKTPQVAQSDLGRLLGGPTTLSIVFGLLSAILGGARKMAETERPVLSSMLPSLQTITDKYPDGNLSVLANDLRICIATLGAVWSVEIKESAASVRRTGGGELTKKAKSSAASGLAVDKVKRGPKGTDCTAVEGLSQRHPPQSQVVGEPSQSLSSSVTTSMQTKESKNALEQLPPGPPGPLSSKNEEEAETGAHTAFHQALADLNDPLVPVKGHGLLSLARLLENRDAEALASTESLLSTFREHLRHPDSYIYLAAIKGLAALASINIQSTLPALCHDYAQLSGQGVVSSRLDYDRETGQLKRNDAAPQVVSSLCSFQVRLKLGETLVRVVRDCGEMVPHYSDMILAAVLVNTRDLDPLIRASSLSNLADICPLMRFSFGQIQNEILSCISHVLQSDDEARVRQAALVVLKQLISGLSQDIVKVLGDSLKDIYRLLKQVAGMERDELTRTHALAALGELDTVMKGVLFPQPSLSKKITILDNF